jgi:tRNA(fMet)-specific endonuclease VapC
VIYLLDTNTLVYALNRRGGVRERVNDAALRSRLATSSIVVAELLYGAGRSARPEENRRVVIRGLERFQIVPFTFATAEHFARLMTDLSAKGKPPPRVDLMIAATALELGATLVTHDNDLLSAPISALTVIDWFTPEK